MQKITTFLTYDHQAEEAMNFYVSIFKNSKIINTSLYGDGAPMPKGTFMTGTFELDGQQFMVLNGGPHFKFEQGFSLFVKCETQEEIDEFWNKFSEGGGKPVQCGWITDKFGVSWQIVPVVLMELLHGKDMAKAARVMAAMMKMVKLDIKTLKQAAE